MSNTESRQKLRKCLPLNMVATKQWLLDQGLGLHFLDNAVRSKTLQPLAAGVYAMYEATASWQGVVASLQRMSKEPIHVGGLTALNLAGLSHFLEAHAKTQVTLYSDAPLPNWLNRISVRAQFEWHGTRRLWPSSVMTTDSKFLREYRWHEERPAVVFSCPEKAMLEVLMDVPSTVSFEHADALMQGLHNLSPRKVNALLTVCRSVKAKRLFLWLAERHEHAWFKHLRPDEYDLGSGKRVIAENGKLDVQWAITVPGEMHGERNGG